MGGPPHQRRRLRASGAQHVADRRLTLSAKARRPKEVAIAADGLRKRFGANIVALDGLDLEVSAGSVYGLLGPNGAGKTTAVRVLTTVLHPDAGRASVLGYDVTTQARDVRRNIGLAGQNAAVDENLTGRENLTLVGRLTHLDSKRSSSVRVNCSIGSISWTPPTDR